jgi:hypothetical protein
VRRWCIRLSGDVWLGAALRIGCLVITIGSMITAMLSTHPVRTLQAGEIALVAAVSLDAIISVRLVLAFYGRCRVA